MKFVRLTNLLQADHKAQYGILEPALGGEQIRLIQGNPLMECVVRPEVFRLQNKVV